jgi:hypothetical protein
MFEIRDSDIPLRDIEAQNKDFPGAPHSGISLGGKRDYASRRNQNKANDHGESIISLLLHRKILRRVRDEEEEDEGLDLSYRFTAVLIENLASFGDLISKLASDTKHRQEILRCCVLAAVMEFYEYQYSKEVSDATTFIVSLIITEENLI